MTTPSNRDFFKRANVANRNGDSQGHCHYRDDIVDHLSLLLLGDQPTIHVIDLTATETYVAATTESQP